MTFTKIFIANLIFLIGSSIAQASNQENYLQSYSIKETNLKKEYINTQDRLNRVTTPTQYEFFKKRLKEYINTTHEVTRKEITKENIEEVNLLLSQGKISLYAESIGYTPVLYTEKFSDVFGGQSGGLLLDDYNQIDPLEFVAFPTTIFKIKSFHFDRNNLILRVNSDEYPYIGDTGHYIDERFVKIYWNPIASPRGRTVLKPQSEDIISRLRTQVGKTYIWGGNTDTGMSRLLKLYHPKSAINKDTKLRWMLDGFDCSGLLFWATRGYTPRNTSNLVNFGSGLSISGSTAEDIRKQLKPLDMIAWVGHVIIILDNNEAIESTVNFTDSGLYSETNGVRIRKLDEVLQKVMEKRIPVNSWKDTVPEGKKKFVIRRWIEN